MTKLFYQQHKRLNNKNYLKTQHATDLKLEAENNCTGKRYIMTSYYELNSRISINTSPLSLYSYNQAWLCSQSIDQPLTRN